MPSPSPISEKSFVVTTGAGSGKLLCYFLPIIDRILRVFRFMSADQAVYPIRTMARVLKVSASGYYARRSRPASSCVRMLKDGTFTSN